MVFGQFVAIEHRFVIIWVLCVCLVQREPEFVESVLLVREVDAARGCRGTAGIKAEIRHKCVNTILEGCATLAQLDYVPDLSSHSLRRGMATSAHRAGADFRDIKKQGGWRHDGTVQGYIEEASRFEENAAGSLLRTRVKPA